MSKQRHVERSADFIKAAERLAEACAQPENSFIRDSVIQRFEFCWELSWKVLRLRLAILGVEVLSPRDAFQEALAKGLIQDGNAWSKAQKMRNLTSHTYDEALAATVYRFVCDEGQTLFAQLATTVRQWQTENT
jgi:nucleotidyltransferase substrate binding protein (TIGR01987 family)